MRNENPEDEVQEKKIKLSCCRSYLTPKGRCYTCPETENMPEESDPEEE